MAPELSKVQFDYLRCLSILSKSPRYLKKAPPRRGSVPFGILVEKADEPNDLVAIGLSLEEFDQNAGLQVEPQASSSLRDSSIS